MSLNPDHQSLALSYVFKSAPLGHVLKMCCHFHQAAQMITWRTKGTLSGWLELGKSCYGCRQLTTCIPADTAAWPTDGFCSGFCFCFFPQRAHEDWVTRKQYCELHRVLQMARVVTELQSRFDTWKRLLVLIWHMHTQILTSVRGVHRKDSN